MILITGGMYQGKRDFVISEFGLTEDEFRDAGSSVQTAAAGAGESAGRAEGQMAAGTAEAGLVVDAAEMQANAGTDGQNPALDLSGRAIDHLEQFILSCVRAGVSASAYLKAHEKELSGQILIAADITQGIVPMDPVERAWREETGRCLVWLAQQADQVIRVFCGIPQRVK